MDTADVLQIAEPIIVTLAARLLRSFSEADREDAGQECRLHVWRKIEVFHAARGELRGFLHTIIRNRLLDYRDTLKAQRRPRSIEDDDATAPSGGADELIEQLTTDPTSLLTAIDASLLGLLNTSSNRDQLASKLGTTKHAVDQRVFRLRKTIRELAA